METKTLLGSVEIKAMRILSSHLRDLAVNSADQKDEIHNIAEQLYNLTLCRIPQTETT